MADDPVVVVREPGRTPLYLVVREPLEVGRAGAGLLLDDPGVSRHHLELAPDDGRLRVRDLGSSNGTFVGDRQISDPVLLRPGDVVRAGDTTIELEGLRGSATHPPLPQTGGVTSIARVAAEVAASRPSAPSQAMTEGTVTIVFSDIESSTRLAEQYGDTRWMGLLGAHNDIIRQEVVKHGGAEVKAVGDGFMLAFSSARQALNCTMAVQRAVRDRRRDDEEFAISVRFGAHTGEVIVGDDGDLFGHHVNLAARIADQADGGEILVSSLVKEIVEARGDIHFGAPRSVAMKGLSGRHLLHPVLWDEAAPDTASPSG